MGKRLNLSNQKIQKLLSQHQNLYLFISELQNFELLSKTGLNKKELDSSNDNIARVYAVVNKKMCTQCLIAFMMDLNLLSDKIGNKNITLAGNFKSQLSFDKFMQSFSDDYKTILLNDITKSPNINKLFSAHPRIFVLDSNYNTSLFFSPDELPELRKKYFTVILPEYFNKQ